MSTRRLILLRRRWVRSDGLKPEGKPYAATKSCCDKLKAAAAIWSSFRNWPLPRFFPGGFWRTRPSSIASSNEKCRVREQPAYSRKRRGLRSASLSVTPSLSKCAAPNSASTLQYWSTSQVRSSASIAKCTYQATPTTGRSAASNTLRSSTSNQGISVFPCGELSAASWGMCICNDRRWPETYRVMGLQGVEMIMLGYNTPNDHTGHADIDGLSRFHNHLSMQSGAYQNSTWVIGAAK